MNIDAFRGAVLAESVYAGDQLIALNTSITLPDVSATTADLTTVGGIISMPNFHRIESMECSISKHGLDKSWVATIKPEAFDLIANIVQQKTANDGAYEPEHLKAYLRVIPKTIAGGDFGYGDNIERDLTFEVISYKLTINGELALHVDKPNGIFNVGGKDYNEKVRSML